jgi:hypothetical protein
LTYLFICSLCCKPFDISVVGKDRELTLQTFLLLFNFPLGPAHYNEYLNTLLSVSKKLSPKGKLKRSKKVCKVNSLSLPTGSMKMLDVKVEGIMYQSLIDT